MVRRRKLEGGGVPHPHHFNQKLVADLLHFSQRQYDCLDYDPFHPLLHYLGETFGLDREEHLWLSTLYMAFYNIGSTWAAFKSADRRKPLPDWWGSLPIGVQRRNLYGGKVLKHLESFLALSREHGSIYNYLTAGFSEQHPYYNWFQLQRNVGRSWGNGRWSVYTTSELYQKVNKLKVLPNDIMNEGSSGPRSGLCRIYDLQDPARQPVALLDQLADELFLHMRSKLETEIFYLPTGHYDHGMLESQLCDFNSMCKGRYYVGRDIDRDQERITAAERRLKLLGKRMPLDDVWRARQAVFDKRYLGEFGGWPGMTDTAKTHYYRTGEIADHQTIREEHSAGRFF